jgi:hypothetical protein
MNQKKTKTGLDPTGKYQTVGCSPSKSQGQLVAVASNRTIFRTAENQL